MLPTFSHWPQILLFVLYFFVITYNNKYVVLLKPTKFQTLTNFPSIQIWQCPVVAQSFQLLGSVNRQQALEHVCYVWSH
jgi:hypothetical protein